MIKNNYQNYLQEEISLNNSLNSKSEMIINKNDNLQQNHS